MNNNIIKCSRCKVNLPEDNFEKNRSGKFYKMCNQCREYKREYSQKNKCPHNKQKSTCRECNGKALCEHNKQGRQCRECNGSAICEHNKYKNICKKCKGGGICEHDKQRQQCPTCNPAGYTAMIVRSAVRRGINGSSKSKKSIEYLGCSILAFREHIEKQFVDDMCWENQGAWHIDHLIPLKYDNPTDEQIIERLHYKNCQPLWACDNLKKGNRYIG